MLSSNDKCVLVLHSLLGNISLSYHKVVNDLFLGRFIIISTDWPVNHDSAEICFGTGGQAGVHTLVRGTGGVQAAVIIHNALPTDSSSLAGDLADFISRTWRASWATRI